MIETKYKFWRRYLSQGVFLFVTGVPLLFLLYKSDILDYEGFSFMIFYQVPLWIYPFAYTIWNIYNTKDCIFSELGVEVKSRNSLFIAKKEIKGYSHGFTGPILRTGKGTIHLNEGYLKNFEEIYSFIKGHYPLLEAKDRSSLSYKATWIVGSVIISFAVVVLLVDLNYSEKFGNLKYSLPLKKIKVVEIEGRISTDNRLTSFALLGYPHLWFKYPFKYDLIDEVNNEAAYAITEQETKVKLKIRKSDVAKLKSEGFKKYKESIRFYELMINNEVLLRKKYITVAKP